ncbi:hypothetical protein [Flavobacterium sp.]|jgi:hypothetical protein|nr:MAG: hypothetical protein EOO20_16935 [Chryseobacterium sp.]
MQPNEITDFFRKLEQDSRLNVWHLAILIAVAVLALNQGRYRRIKVSRSKMMAKSHINTVPTYHKYFKDLQDMGYISYRPSYHPGVRSELDLLKQP